MESRNTLLEETPLNPAFVGGEGLFPLSFSQKRIWFLEQLEPGGSVYNIPLALRLVGLLDVETLQRSLNEIVRRHEVLRASFLSVGGQPVQAISPSLALSLNLVDLTALPATQREDEAQRLTNEETKAPFDLARGPLLRAILLRLSAEDHILVLTVHHIVYDAWSTRVLYRELSALYEAFSKGNSSPLAELPIQYTDFAQWQREWLQGEVLDRQLSYWKKQLGDIPEVVNLPTDYPRPAVQSFRGGRQSLVFSKGLSDALKALSRKERATLFMTLLAAFQALLYRYTGQENIAVGSPIANRNRSEIEDLIGFFLNTLVLRTDFSGTPSFRELLHRVRKTALEAYEHQDLPFEKLLEELRPERDLSRTPLFQIFFNMINVRATTLELPGLEVHPLSDSDVESKFDLTVCVTEQNQQLQVNLIYNSDLYEPGTIRRLLGRYCTLLKGIAENPDRAISHYRLLTEEEREKLAGRRKRIRPGTAFVEFKREEVEQSIVARFERQVALFPEKAAVNSDYQWSYGELNRRANQIARALLQRRDSEHERVALLYEQGAAMIGAILGVLKSGKAYVPMEPTYPVEWLGSILRETDAAVILTDRKNHGLARELAHGNRAIIDIDGFDPTMPAENPCLSLSPEAMAYILYTSGSTGQPKGVMQNHRNLLHHIRCYTNSLHIVSEDKLTLMSSYSFDAAVMDIFGALLNGATLYPLDVRENEPRALRGQIMTEGVTIYHSTPTVYRYLCEGLRGRDELVTVRLVVLGGEEAQTTDLALFQEFFSQDCLLVNGLGPTESTLALQYFMNHASKPVERIVPVGYPVEETEVSLLNPDGTDAEIYGEIGIKSEHLALGYWSRADLTKAVFLSQPNGTGGRLYRTGDMGRLLADGSIGYLGRRDRQLKIRGYRVEIGEIEAVLNQHPGVRQSAVVARERATGNRSVVAYVVAAPSVQESPQELRAFLRDKLPNYMVPSAFVYLDALPLRPNGKLDTEALPALDQTRPELKEIFVAPRDAAEKTIAEIWSEVLKLDTVGVHDNFFDLGGHSLLATQVVSRIRKVLQADLPLRVFFEKPTVASLSDYIEAVHWAGKENSQTFGNNLGEMEETLL